MVLSDPSAFCPFYSPLYFHIFIYFIQFVITVFLKNIGLSSSNTRPTYPLPINITVCRGPAFHGLMTKDKDQTPEKTISLRIFQVIVQFLLLHVVFPVSILHMSSLSSTCPMTSVPSIISSIRSVHCNTLTRRLCRPFDDQGPS